jgi:hypothetical protein
MKRSMGVAAVAAVLWGCASAPPPPAPVYEAATDMNSPGYLTAPAENDRFMVSYTGTKGMSREQVAQFALLRAAEFTAESGKEWFAVISTKTQTVVPTPSKEDLKNRSGGGFIGGPGGSSTGAGGSGAPASRGTVDPTTGGGATAGGFGGGAPPSQVLERWTPPKVPQTVIVIQMGSGDKAEFPGLDKAPEIFAAKSTADDIRAKMKP